MTRLPPAKVRVVDAVCDNGHEIGALLGDEFPWTRRVLPAVGSAEDVRSLAETGRCEECGAKVRIATEPVEATHE